MPILLIDIHIGSLKEELRNGSKPKVFHGSLVCCSSILNWYIDS